jgi:hypothetical protein
LCAPKRGPAPACVHTARPRSAHKERQARNMQPNSNTEMVRLSSPFFVGAQHAAPGVALPGSRPQARSRTACVLASSARIRPEPTRGPQSTAISNRNIPRLEPHLTVAISTDNSFLIATKRANRTFVFFLDTDALQRHLKSAPHYAYLSRHTFERRSARHPRREPAAGVFGLKSRISNQLCRRLEFDATHCKQTTDANSNRRKTGT